VEILTLALTLFIVANPLGNSPIIIALIKNFDFKRQKRLMLQEAFLALLLALFFQYFGALFLDLIAVKDYSLTYTGGILLFLVALYMIFPRHDEGSEAVDKEPFFVPIATPLITGPGVMTTIMIFSQQYENPLTVTLSILLCWVGVTLALYIAPYLQFLLKRRGLIALEQLMGMILMLISIEMIVQATYTFMES